MFEIRPATVIGDVEVSVQASEDHYCSPRVNGLPLEIYEQVEIALLRNGELIRPETVGLSAELVALFETGPCPVAGYVSWPNVKRIMSELYRRRGE